MDVDFDFDCPLKDSYNLSCSQVDKSDHSEWFRTKHISHEIKLDSTQNPVATNKENFKPRPLTVSELSSGKTTDSHLQGKKLSTNIPNKSSKIVETSCVKTTNPVSRIKSMSSKVPLRSANNKTTNSCPNTNKSHVETNAARVKLPASKSNINKTKSCVVSSKTASCEEDIMDMLKTHNKTCGSAALYEPAKHSVRDVRKWEKKSGLVWAKLNPQERARVNQEIDEMKQAAVLI